jgi:hypothetical protein
MSHATGHDRSETLLSETRGVHAGRENPARFIDIFVDGPDLTAARFVAQSFRRCISFTLSSDRPIWHDNEPCHGCAANSGNAALARLTVTLTFGYLASAICPALPMSARPELPIHDRCPFFHRFSHARAFHPSSKGLL